MSATTKIQWTDRTWNPTRGCSVISQGCVNCYAMKQAHRFSGPGKAYDGLTKQTSAGPQWTGVVRTVESALLEPLSWRKPQRVFVNSMSDLFHEDVPFEFIDRVFAVMALAGQHTFQVLTKRATRMFQYMTNRALSADYWKRACPTGYSLQWENISLVPFPLPNVWLGVSAEDQKHADERISRLLNTPAAVRFISAEPLLGPVDLLRYFGELRERVGNSINWRGLGLDWVIVGGESGPGARPARVRWIRDIVGQCRVAGVPAFVKQLGAKPEGDPRQPERVDPVTGARTLTVMQTVEIHDRKGGDISEWPDDLKVRQFPEARS